MIFELIWFLCFHQNDSNHKCKCKLDKSNFYMFFRQLVKMKTAEGERIGTRIHRQTWFSKNAKILEHFWFDYYRRLTFFVSAYARILISRKNVYNKLSFSFEWIYFYYCHSCAVVQEWLGTLWSIQRKLSFLRFFGEMKWVGWMVCVIVGSRGGGGFVMHEF